MAKNKLTSKGKLKSKDKKGGKKNITLNSTLNKKSKPKQVSNPNIKKSNKVDSRKSNLNLKSESKNLSLKTKPLKFSLNKSLLALSIIIIFAIILVISFLVINNNSNIFPNLSQGKANKIIDVSSDMPESVVDQSMVVSSPVVSPASGNYFSSVGV
ncbi:MAG: hypothetical protein PHR48_01695, partial [Candidatus ainarchaeum sp.]|nr:hypothetical protein [Candidatus ainarchaeum sp.]